MSTRVSGLGADADGGCAVQSPSCCGEVRGGGRCGPAGHGSAQARARARDARPAPSTPAPSTPALSARPPPRGPSRHAARHGIALAYAASQAQAVPYDNNDHACVGPDVGKFLTNLQKPRRPSRRKKKGLFYLPLKSAFFAKISAPFDHDILESRAYDQPVVADEAR